MLSSVNSPIFRMVISSVVITGGLTLGAIALAPQSAQAALLARDLNSVGDGLLTRDTATGLDWLDVSQTKGRSYGEVLAGFGGYTTQQGFRFATANEVSALFDSALVGKSSIFSRPTPYNIVDLPQSHFAAQEINTLLGKTSSTSFQTGVSNVRFSSQQTDGYVSDLDSLGQLRLASIYSSRVTQSFFVGSGGVGLTSQDIGTGSISVRSPQISNLSQYASFLVRSSAPVASTPEPSVLLGTVAIALAGLTQGRTKSTEV